MLISLSNWLYRNINGWVALVGVVIFLLFSLMVLPAQSAGSDRGLQTPDLSLTYTPDDLYRMAEVYGETGRREYIHARFTYDLVWPIVYGLFLTTALTWLFAKAFPTESAWRIANLSPILGVLFDYLENISTSLVMLRYPQETPIAVSLAPIFTLLKWILVGGSFALLLIGVMAALWNEVKKRN
jgi:hypothetical protein